MDVCFAADRTLGKLAKWLRIIGYDTIYEPGVSCRCFFEYLQEGRILITRTEKLKQKFANHKLVFITSNYLVEQLKQVVEDVGISLADIRPFSRCLQCNLPIVDVNKDDVFSMCRCTAQVLAASWTGCAGVPTLVSQSWCTARVAPT